MPLLFQPTIGHILICDYDKGFVVPEMVKKRPVIVVSRPRRYNHRLCTVVPISSTEPNPVEPFHYLLPQGIYPLQKPGNNLWVKCDMLNTVSYDRLDRIRVGKGNGKRIYEAPIVPANVLQKVQEAIRHALDL